MRAWLAVSFSLLGLVAATADARQTPIVRVTAVPDVVAVGEPVELQVTVLVPTWFSRPSIYPSFELANAITRLPPDSSYPSSERINGETWSAIVRSYTVYPLLGATYRMSDRVITVSYADPDTRRAVSVEIDVPVIEFRAQVPAGAESLEPYLGGRGLTLTREVKGDMTLLEVGDALVLHYTAELDGMPAIFLPPLIPKMELPGVLIYPDEPILAQKERARRSEKLTLVFESGGEFTLPAVELRWWNTVAHKLETASLPALTLSVAGPPVSEQDKTAPGRWPVLAASAAVFFFLVLAGLYGKPRLLKSWQSVRERRRHSQDYAFVRLRRALLSGDPHAIHTALLTWSERLGPDMTARDFAARFGDAELQSQIEQLKQTLYSATAQNVDFRLMKNNLVAARRRYQRELCRNEICALPRLNPSG